MTNIKEQLEKALGHTITESNIAGVDYQCNAAFAIAKKEGAKPSDVATKIIAKVKPNLRPCFSTHPSGFININVLDKDLSELTEFVLKTNKLPLSTQKPRTIFFDYGGANVAKELHAGHIRPPIIGEALKRTFTAFGHKTFADPHLGDWGLQIGLIFGELELKYKEPSKFPKLTIEMLNVLYPQASKRKSEDKKFHARAEELTLKLQRSEEPWFTKWKEIMDVSVPRIKENYDALGCTFDTFEGEYKAQQFIPKIIADFQKKKVVQESDGCIIMDVKTDSDTRPMPPIIISKSNGGDLYSTTDIGTIFYRQKENNPDEHVYITDFRQDLHFEQVFRAVKKGGLVKPEVVFTHIGHGTMLGKDGKPFKTRSGDTVKLEDVINLVTDAAHKKMQNPCLVSAKTIGIAALKFADLSNSVRKDYVFDLDRFTSFEGKTGPYLLYTIARINSILSKTEKEIQTNNTKSPLLRDIKVAVMRLGDSFDVATRVYSLNGVIDATYNLASKFNILYANETIQNNAESIRVARLTRTALCFALDILAIDTVEKM
ncbi:MAG: arginine--tRNA ligase [Firmicutes bacterium]|nr:arginine--tRNA ligase [Bacillota bacterium]